MADQKLSELTLATGASSSDLLYIVQSNTSKRITVQNLANAVLDYQGGNVADVLYGSSTVTSAGLNETAAWFSYDGSVYAGALVQFQAEEDRGAIDWFRPHTLGHTNLYSTEILTGNYHNEYGLINVHGDIVYAPPQVNGNIISLHFTRADANDTSSIIKIRYVATLFKR